MGKGGSPFNWGRINKIGVRRGGRSPYVHPTLGNLEHVNKALNQSPKNLRKKTVLNKSQKFQVL